MRPLNFERGVLERVLENIDHISELLQTITPESFISDLKDYNALCLELVHIGEKVHQLPEAFVEAHPEVPWHELYGLRNRIVHGYEKVKKSIVWATVTQDIPEIQIQLIKIVASL